MKLLGLLLILLLSNLSPSMAKLVDCMESIETALADFIFFSEYELGDYYANLCNNTFGVISLWAATKTYCTPKEIAAGTVDLGSLCQLYGPGSLTPYDQVAPKLTADDLAAMQVVEFADIDATKIWNNSVLLSPELYTLAFKTNTYFEEEYVIHARYGFAMYGFWGGVLLLGMINRLVTYIVHSRRGQTANDIESSTATHVSQKEPTYLTLLKAPYYWVRSNLIIPSAYGSHHQQLLWWFSIPTRMETLVLLAFWFLSAALSGVNLKIFDHNLYYTLHQQPIRYVADRTGYLSYNCLPIMWMFAGRNNVFLWATGWSFSTFNLFHRHIARAATLEAIVHSILWSMLELEFKSFTYSWTQQYWYMGGMATIAMALILGFSSIFMRQKCYEVFLIIHICLSIVTIVGLFFHTSIFDGTYEPYLWPIVAIWVFDRAARIVRQIYCNVHVRLSGSIVKTSSSATYDAAANFIRLEVIPGGRFVTPKPGQHYFLYQPLRWRGWENHPFTLASWEDISTFEHDVVNSTGSKTASSPDVTNEVNKLGTSHTINPVSDRSTVSASANAAPGTTNIASPRKLVFYIRPFSGWTNNLRTRCLRASVSTYSPSAVSIPVSLLMEGPYGHSAPLHTYDTVLLLTGGTGISGATSFLQDHLKRTSVLPMTTRTTSITLLWATKQEAMIRHLATKELVPVLARPDVRTLFFATSKNATNTVSSPVVAISSSSNADISSVEDTHEDGKKNDEKTSPFAGIAQSSSSSQRARDVVIQYKRPNIKSTVLDAIEAEGLVNSRKIAVLVCGPAGMADEARSAVHVALKRGWKGVEYFEETFGW